MTESEHAQETRGEEPVPDDVSSDVVYGLLADKRRRYTLHYLKQQGDPIEVREVAEQVAAWENGKSVDELTSQERKRVYIALYQSHLPTLDEEGVVEYDQDRGVVELSQPMLARDIYMEVVPKGNVPWSIYYVGLVCAGTVLLALAWLDVYPFGMLPDIAWAFVILATFAASAFVQTFQSHRMRFGDEGPPPELDEQ